jgi:hypothetical protein
MTTPQHTPQAELFPESRPPSPLRLTGTKTTRHLYHCDERECDGVCVVRCARHSPPRPADA